MVVLVLVVVGRRRRHCRCCRPRWVVVVVVEVWSVAYSLDGKLVASGSQKGHINIYHVQDLNTPVKTTLETGDKFLLTVAFVSDREQPGGRDGIVLFSEH